MQEIGGVPRHDAALDRLTVDAAYPTTFYLRLSQTEGVVQAAASPDGTTWAPVGRTGNAGAFGTPRIGVSAVTNDDGVRDHGGVRLGPRPQALRRADTTPPAVTATPDGLRTSDGKFLNSATVDAGRDRPRRGIDNVEYALGDGAVPALHGAHQGASGTIRYRATDKAGNTSALGSTTVTIATPPACDPVAAEPGFKRLYDGTVAEHSPTGRSPAPAGSIPRGGDA